MLSVDATERVLSFNLVHFTFGGSIYSCNGVDVELQPKQLFV